jgi:hypothetical protein
MDIRRRSLLGKSQQQRYEELIEPRHQSKAISSPYQALPCSLLACFFGQGFWSRKHGCQRNSLAELLAAAVALLSPRDRSLRTGLRSPHRNRIPVQGDGRQRGAWKPHSLARRRPVASSRRSKSLKEPDYSRLPPQRVVWREYVVVQAGHVEPVSESFPARTAFLGKRLAVWRESMHWQADFARSCGGFHEVSLFRYAGNSRAAAGKLFAQSTVAAAQDKENRIDDRKICGKVSL